MKEVGVEPGVKETGVMDGERVSWQATEHKQASERQRVWNELPVTTPKKQCSPRPRWLSCYGPSRQFEL